MNVEFRIKWDPRADGRVASPGEMIEAWVEWHCPDDQQYLVRIRTVSPDGTAYVEDQSVRTSWTAVRNYFNNQGVVLPASPSCPGF